jgi:hypothetical protein
MTKNRKKKRNGLSRACLGYTNDVAARHDGRNRLGLNGCWSCIVQSLDNIQPEKEVASIEGSDVEAERMTYTLA